MGYIQKFPSEQDVPRGKIFVSMRNKEDGKPSGVKRYVANRYVIYEDGTLSLFNDDSLIVTFGVDEWRSVA